MKQSVRAKIEAERDRLLKLADDLNRTLDILSMFDSPNGHRSAAVAATADDTPAPAPKKKRAGRPMSAAARKAISRRMRAYWRERRATQ
jgi:hypothetical protein